MTLGSAAAARVRLTVWCRDCRHWVEPNPADGCLVGACPRLALAAGLFAARQPAGRYSGERGTKVERDRAALDRH
jgi:hypothetical protein